MARTKINPLTDKSKKGIIKPPHGMKSKTVMVKIYCSLDPGDKNLEPSMGWLGLLNWKQANMKKVIYMGMMLSEIVGDISKDVRKKLREMHQDQVDIIFSMPMGSDHKLTIYNRESDIEKALKAAATTTTRDGDMNAYD